MRFFRRGQEQVYEGNVQELLRRLVRAGWVCADVGAYRGEITRLLASLVGDSGRVIAFEAHPATASELRDALVEYENVLVEAVAVAEEDSEATLYAGRPGLPSEWNLRGFDVEGEPAEALGTIRTVSLDSYFGDEPVNLVKIDVEGAEGLVFAGMPALLRQQRPHLVVEFHDDACWAARRLLTEAGYRLLTTEGVPIAADAERVYHVHADPGQ